MVNYSTYTPNQQMDFIFKALSDPTRRNILERLTLRVLTVSEVAQSYDMSLPAISKHLRVLEGAHLIKRNKYGREHKLYFEPKTMKTASEYINHYKKYWNKQLDQLEKFLANPPVTREVKKKGR